jgi:hypothetical protein
VLRKFLMTMIMAAPLAASSMPVTAASPNNDGWQNGVWTGAGWAWRGGRGWAGRWVWKRGDLGPGWGGFYPGPGYYPFDFPYGYAYPYAPRGYYGCYRPVPLDSQGRTFARLPVC